MLRSNQELEMYMEDEVQPIVEDAEPPTQPADARPSWVPTAVVGVVMLVVGVLAGYFGRPLVTPQPVAPTPVVVADSGATNPSTSNPSSAALMDAVVAQTRHFKGDPAAPITIVEFGDFQ